MPAYIAFVVQFAQSDFDETRDGIFTYIHLRLAGSVEVARTVDGCGT